MLFIHQHWTQGQEYYHLCSNKAYLTHTSIRHVMALVCQGVQCNCTSISHWGILNREIMNKKHRNAKNVTLRRWRNEHLLNSITSKTGRQSAALFDLDWKCVHQISQIFHHWESANDWEGSMDVDLGLTKNFSKWVNFQIQNLWTMSIDYMYVHICICIYMCVYALRIYIYMLLSIIIKITNILYVCICCDWRITKAKSFASHFPAIYCPVSLLPLKSYCFTSSNKFYSILS